MSGSHGAEASEAVNEPRPRRGPTKRIVIALVLALILSGSGFAFTRAALQPTAGTFSGAVIDLDGNPIAGATVEVGRNTVETDSSGQFRVTAAGEASWVAVTHPNFVPRTRPAAPGQPLLVRMTPRNPNTISIQFTGDVMMGRRFYDPNQDGDTGDGLVQPGGSAKAHKALLDDVQPLIESSDLTVVNLETPLMETPYYDPTLPRPEAFHQTKEFAFASDPVTAEALLLAGVDVVDLGNNHVFDGLDEGVAETIEALDQAGLPYFGAGRNEQEAWAPAVIDVRGQQVAFLGCTSINGDDLQPLTYVASATKGGAARCDEDAISLHVAEAKAKYETVVFMVHGGYEYVREPSPGVQSLTEAARAAGASLVVNHHPHVLGGFDWNGSSLVAWTMGNFLFDQTVWPTFYSAVLSVHMEAGRTVRAYAEPIVIAGYKPRGAVGELADYIAREAAGRASGPFLIENGAMEVDVRGAATSNGSAVEMTAGEGAASIAALGQGDWISNVSAGHVEFGRNLLWAGTFEDEYTGAAPKQPRLWGFVKGEDREAAYWLLGGTDKVITSAAAYRGEQGVRIRRTSDNRDALVLTTIHRIMIEPGSRLTVTGMVRMQPDTRLEAQLSWYSDTKGPSVAQSVVSIAPDGDGWASFRVDAVAPPNVLAIGLYFRLTPPDAGTSVVDLDDIALISWAPEGVPASPLYDTVRLSGTASVTIEHASLPGAEAWAAVDAVRQLPAGTTASTSVIGSDAASSPAHLPSADD